MRRVWRVMALATPRVTNRLARRYCVNRRNMIRLHCPKSVLVHLFLSVHAFGRQAGAQLSLTRFRGYGCTANTLPLPARVVLALTQFRQYEVCL